MAFEGFEFGLFCSNLARTNLLCCRFWSSFRRRWRFSSNSRFVANMLAEGGGAAGGGRIRSGNRATEKRGKGKRGKCRCSGDDFGRTLWLTFSKMVIWSGEELVPSPCSGQWKRRHGGSPVFLA